MGRVRREMICMTGLDTNVLIYSIDRPRSSNGRKPGSCSGDFTTTGTETVLPWQVVGELFAIFERRRIGARSLAPPGYVMSNSSGGISPWSCRPRSSWIAHLDLTGRYSLSHWDSMLLGACIEAGIDTLYTEDMGEPRVIWTRSIDHSIRVIASDPFLDQYRHPVGSGHDLVIMGGGLANHVGDGDPSLVGNEQASDSLADAVPDPSFEGEGRRDVNGDGPRIRQPPSLIVHSQVQPVRGKNRLCPAVAPADDLERPSSRPAASACGRGTGTGPRARRPARGRGGTGRAARSNPWAVRSMPR